MGVCRRRVGYVTRRRSWSAVSANMPNMQWHITFAAPRTPDMATTELVLETAIDALTRRTLVVANLLGTLEAEIFQAPGFGSQFLRPGLVATRVDVNQRDVAE